MQHVSLLLVPTSWFPTMAPYLCCIAGVDTGVNMRLAGQGDAGVHGGPNGHMYVQINVAKDPFFERKGSDVFVKVGLVSVTPSLLLLVSGFCFWFVLVLAGCLFAPSPLCAFFVMSCVA